MARNKIERDLTFLGLLIFENKLKTSAEEVIYSLKNSGCRCIMSTGDNILTSVAVAKQCGIINKNIESVIIGDVRNVNNKKQIVWCVDQNDSLLRECEEVKDTRYTTHENTKIEEPYEKHERDNDNVTNSKLLFNDLCELLIHKDPRRTSIVLSGEAFLYLKMQFEQYELPYYDDCEKMTNDTLKDKCKKGIYKEHLKATYKYSLKDTCKYNYKNEYSLKERSKKMYMQHKIYRKTNFTKNNFYFDKTWCNEQICYNKLLYKMQNKLFFNLKQTMYKKEENEKKMYNNHAFKKKQVTRDKYIRNIKSSKGIPSLNFIWQSETKKEKCKPTEKKIRKTTEKKVSQKSGQKGLSKNIPKNVSKNVPKNERKRNLFNLKRFLKIAQRRKLMDSLVFEESVTDDEEVMSDSFNATSLIRMQNIKQKKINKLTYLEKNAFMNPKPLLSFCIIKENGMGKSKYYGSHDKNYLRKNLFYFFNYFIKARTRRQNKTEPIKTINEKNMLKVNLLDKDCIINGCSEEEEEEEEEGQEKHINIDMIKKKQRENADKYKLWYTLEKQDMLNNTDIFEEKENKNSLFSTKLKEKKFNYIKKKSSNRKEKESIEDKYINKTNNNADVNKSSHFLKMFYFQRMKRYHNQLKRNKQGSETCDEKIIPSTSVSSFCINPSPVSNSKTEISIKKKDNKYRRNISQINEINKINEITKDKDERTNEKYMVNGLINEYLGCVKQSLNHKCKENTCSKFSHIKHIKMSIYEYILRTCTVYARMNPDHKTQLILSLKNLPDNPFIGMCGDGSNDCGALNSADVGISLSNNESSICAPFTSDNFYLDSVINVLIEGRAALVNSFQLFKFISLYSIIQCSVVLILYMLSNNLTDNQFIYIDIFTILPLSIFMSWTPASDKLSTDIPLGKLFCFPVLFNLYGQIVIQLIFIFASLFLLFQQPFYKNDNSSGYPLGDASNKKLICSKNSVTFTVSSFQILFICVALNIKTEWRKSVVTNIMFVGWILILLFVNIAITMLSTETFLIGFLVRFLKKALNLVILPLYFRFYLFIILFINFICTFAFEKYCIRYLEREAIKTNYKHTHINVHPIPIKTNTKVFVTYL